MSFLAGMTNAFVEQNSGSVFFKTRMKNASGSDAGSTLIANPSIVAMQHSLPSARTAKKRDELAPL